MEWYTDVMHEIKPVKSGYQLKLCYNLIHMTTSPRPALADTFRTTERLRNILLSWRQSLRNKPSPEKIVSLLQYLYSNANYRGNTLKCSDARAVAILESLGEELGFRLGLALVECHWQGVADDELNSSDNEPDSGDLDDSADDEPDSRDLNFLGIPEKSMKIMELVSLDGTLLKKKLKLTEEDEDGQGAEFIPADLRRVVENGPHGAAGAHSSLERWYRRTVLVIWPKQHDEQILHGTYYTRVLLYKLSKTSASKPTEAEQKILEYALGLPPKEPKMSSIVLRGVCKVACIWKSSELWCRAIEVCDGSEFIDKVGKKLYLKGLLHLEPGTVLPSDVLASLRPLASDDCDLVLDAVASLGGIADFERIVLPQLRDSADAITLVAFGTAIHQEINKSHTRIFVSPSDTSLGCHIIHDLLTLSIERAQLFTPTSSRNASQSYPERREPTLNLTFTLVKACITTYNDFLICRITNKLIPFAPPDSLTERRTRAEDGAVFNSCTVWEDVAADVRQAQPKRDRTRFDDATGEQCGDLDDLIQSIISQFNALSRKTPAVKAFVRELRDLMTEHPSLIEELEAVITASIKAMIKSLQPDALRGQGAIVEWLEYCAATGNIDACSEVINQVTQDASSANGTRLTSEFLPLLPTLMSWLSRRGKPYRDQPYPLLFQTVIFGWLKTALGTTKLADVAQQLAIVGNCRCTCRPCAQVMRWSVEPSKQAAMSLSCIGASNVNHLEKNLRQYASKVADWIVSRTSPHGIEVFKKSRVHRAQNRRTSRAAGLAALRAISADESVPLSIFGEEVYKMVIQMLEVPYINANIGIAAPGDGTPGPSNPTQVVSEGDSRRRGNLSVQPPRKRRRVDENVQIIDITAP
ncbi:hypothetical protein FS837_001740 [Tulasnella sp. UAMH 9824]|nr:hypothetical protein FS837_001740 [Tulasnella sp. UAMH 9824]